jgi:hypothetical protein
MSDEAAAFIAALIGAVLGILVGYFALIGAANGGPFSHEWVIAFARKGFPPCLT